MKRTDVMKRVISSVLALSVLGFAVPALAARDPAMDAANRAFGEGRYGEASTAFEALIAERGPSAPLLFDLGNAYLREDKPVRAILEYERAQLLAPRDPAIAANLAAARTTASVSDDRGSLERVTHPFRMNTWIWLTVGAFWAAGLAIALARLSKTRRTLFVTFALSSTCAVALFGFAVWLAGKNFHRALVMVPTPVLVSPFDSAQSDFALQPGSHVELGRVRDKYVFIRDSRGRNGWIERSEVEPLAWHQS